MNITFKKSKEDIEKEMREKYPKSFYDLGNMREVFNEAQLEAIFIALTEKAKRLRGLSRSIENSGYGNVNTLDKARLIDMKAEYYEQLIVAINQNSI